MRKTRFSPQYAAFLQRLGGLRKRKSVLQAGLAERKGIPQQYISRFETGEPRMDVVRLGSRIARVIDPALALIQVTNKTGVGVGG